MKKVVFFFLCMVQMKAQTITSSGTYFEEGIRDTQWSNANGLGFTKANFKSFSGSCYVLLHSDSTVSVQFEAVTKLKSGVLEMKLIDEEENAYFFCETTNSCEVLKDIVLEAGKKYRLYFTGTQAKGNYNVTWKSNSKN